MLKKIRIPQPKLALRHRKWSVYWYQDYRKFAFATGLDEREKNAAETVRRRLAVCMAENRWEPWTEDIPAIQNWRQMFAGEPIEEAPEPEQPSDAQKEELTDGEVLRMFEAEVDLKADVKKKIWYLASQHNLLTMTEQDATSFVRALSVSANPKYLSDKLALLFPKQLVDRQSIIKGLNAAGINFTLGQLDNALKNREQVKLVIKKNKRYYEVFKTPRRLAPRTVNSYLIAAKKFFRWVVRKGLRPSNPFEFVRPMRCEETADIVFMTRGERDEVLASPDCPLSIWIALLAGLRRGEILRLEWRNIDLDNRWIHVTKSKTGRVRHVPLCSDLLRKLAEVPQKQGTVAKWDPKMNVAAQECSKMALLFPRLQDKLRWNVFRHTFASLLAQSGKVSIDQICAIMGNTPAVCRRHYAYLIPEAAVQTGIDFLNL